MPTTTMPTVGFKVSELTPYAKKIKTDDLFLMSQQQTDLTSYKSSAITYNDFAKNILETISGDIINNIDSFKHEVTTRAKYNSLLMSGRIDSNTLYLISDDYE